MCASLRHRKIMSRDQSVDSSKTRGKPKAFKREEQFTVKSRFGKIQPRSNFAQVKANKTWTYQPSFPSKWNVKGGLRIKTTDFIWMYSKERRKGNRERVVHHREKCGTHLDLNIFSVMSKWVRLRHKVFSSFLYYMVLNGNWKLKAFARPIRNTRTFRNPRKITPGPVAWTQSPLNKPQFLQHCCSHFIAEASILLLIKQPVFWCQHDDVAKRLRNSPDKLLVPEQTTGRVKTASHRRFW